MLFPLAFVYWIIIRCRNLLFDWNILKSAQFNFPVICVGNLAVGGTGKTPMTELLLASLLQKYKVAVLSRGYKRKTKGFAIAQENTTAIEIGDEPMQFHKKFPEAIVAVGEERLIAIPQILFQHPKTEVILLDDALQHRSVRAGFNILLTEYDNLYTRDFMLPMGDLRDTKSESKRADVIIVTKCPSNLTQQQADQIKQELNISINQQAFFTSIVYGKPYRINRKVKETIELDNATTDVILLCGIANPEAIKKQIHQMVHYYEMLRYPDHHIFTSSDLKEIKHHFSKLTSNNKIILTTEKDAVRLEKFGEGLNDLPIYVWPIAHDFLFNRKDDFLLSIDEFIQSNRTVLNHKEN